jgi:putative RecB family exonuclease
VKLSPKAAATYIDCPKRYRFEYVDRPRPHRTGGPWAHTVLGLVVHEVLARWATFDPTERTPKRAQGLLAARWRDDGFRDGEQASQWFTRASDWLEAYCSRPEVQQANVIGNERTVAAVYASEKGGRPINIEGRVDRIDQRDDGLVVIDYKTGKRPPDEAEAAGSYALAVYVYGARRILGRAYGWCTRAEVHHLPTGTIVSVDYTRERIARVLDRLVELAAEIEGATTYPARPSGLCGSCDFLSHCAEGQARATRADGWAYLGTDERDATAAIAAV